jgi:hypothetical protein
MHFKPQKLVIIFKRIHHHLSSASTIRYRRAEVSAKVLLSFDIFLFSVAVLNFILKQFIDFTRFKKLKLLQVFVIMTKLNSNDLITAKDFTLNFALRAHLVPCDMKLIESEEFSLPKWFDAEKFAR